MLTPVPVSGPKLFRATIIILHLHIKKKQTTKRNIQPNFTLLPSKTTAGISLSWLPEHKKSYNFSMDWAVSLLDSQGRIEVGVFNRTLRKHPPGTPGQGEGGPKPQPSRCLCLKHLPLLATIWKQWARGRNSEELNSGPLSRSEGSPARRPVCKVRIIKGGTDQEASPVLNVI